MIIRIVKNETSADGRDMSKYSINGEGEYNKTQASVAAVTMTIKELVEKGGKSLQQAIDRINQIKIDGSFVTVSAEKGFFEEKRCKETVVETSKGKFTIYVNNQWTPKRFGNLFIGMNDAFNTDAERKVREDDEKNGGMFSKVRSIFGLEDAKTEKIVAPKETPKKAEPKSEPKVEAKSAAPTAATQTIDLDKLIAAALADGEVTEKERAILIKKATSVGIDADEFELLLDSKIYEASQKEKSAKSASAPKEKKTKSNDPFEDLMVQVEGGIFTQAERYSEWVQPADKRKKEYSVVREYSRQVKLTSFQICKYQVTQAQWKSVMGNFPHPQEWEGDNLPVHSVSWEDAQQFIAKLNQLSGKNYHLPTEAQWEFAARGGVKSKGYKYAGSDNLDEVAQYKENSWQRVQPVGEKKPNELGLYDMSGNVQEWCFDWYSKKLGNVNVQDPTGPIGGNNRILRGGSYWDFFGCTVSHRNSLDPSRRSNSIGFRLAL